MYRISNDLCDKTISSGNSTTLYSADDADAQMHTTDGHHTLHVMGSTIRKGTFSGKQIESRCLSMEEL